MSTEVDWTPRLLWLRQDVSVTGSRHVAIHMQLMMVGIPRGHAEPDHNREFQPKHHSSIGRIICKFTSQVIGDGQIWCKEHSSDHRRVLRWLVEWREQLSHCDLLVLVVDRPFHSGVVIDSDIPIGVPVRHDERDVWRIICHSGIREWHDVEAWSVWAEAKPKYEEDKTHGEKKGEEDGTDDLCRARGETLLDTVGVGPSAAAAWRLGGWQRKLARRLWLSVERLFPWVRHFQLLCLLYIDRYSLWFSRF